MEALTIPTTVTNKAEFDKWLENDVGNKLTTTQKDALRTDIAAKLGLDMGNAITAYGRAAINADLQYLHNNPNATSIPKLDAELKPGDANGPGQFDGLRAAANRFTDPFLIDITAVLALMHETSEKLRSAAKEVKQAENANQQAQMAAAAADIASQGMFQALAGGLQAAMSIGGGLAGLRGAGGSAKQVSSLKSDIKPGFKDDMMPNVGQGNVGGNQPKLDVQTRARSNAVTERPSFLDAPTTRPRSNAVGERPAFLDAPKTNPQTVQGKSNQVQQKLDDANQTAPTDGKQPTMSRDQFTLRLKEIDASAQKWQGYSMMIDGVGKALGGTFNGIASQYEASKALHDKEAAQAGFEKDATADLVHALSEFSQQIRQTVQAIIQSQDQAAHRVANV